MKLPKGLYQRGTTIWFRVYNPKTGKQDRKTTGLLAKSENIKLARIKREEHKKTLKAPTFIPVDRYLTLGEALQQFIQRKKITDKRSHYHYAVKWLVEACGTNKLVTEYTINDSDTFINFLRYERGYKQNTIADYSSAIQAIFRYLESRNIIDSCPFEAEKSIIVEPKAIPPDDLKEIFDHLLEKNINGLRFLKTLLLTGLRTSEAINLKWDNIDFEKNIITITNGKGRDKDDYLPMLDEARNHFLCFKDDPPFPENRVHKYTTTRPKFYERAQIKLWKKSIYTFHQFRKTYITNLVDSGVDPYQLMTLARHRKVQTTLKYYTEKKLVEIGVHVSQLVKPFVP